MTIKIAYESLPYPLHPRFQNLLGIQFGNLTVVEFVGKTKNSTSLWKCYCSLCGNFNTVDTASLNRGTKSCMCINSMRCVEKNTTHDMTYSREYKTYRGMLDRCYAENNTNYSNYGGRGIKVCKKWLESFENFYSDMGERPQLTSIERIDANGNYEPNNCKWATSKEQSNNKRSSRKFEYKSETLTIKEIASKYNINYNRLKQRILYGWSIERAVESSKILGRQKRYTNLNPRDIDI